MDTYKVTLSGLRPELPTTTAKNQLAVLFKTSADQIERILVQPSYVVKRGLTIDRATQYQQAIEKAGGRCVIESENSFLELDSLDQAPLAQVAINPGSNMNLKVQNSAEQRSAEGSAQGTAYCSACGGRLNPEAAFCGTCGKAVASTVAPQPVESPLGKIPETEAEQIFVGKKYDYFEMKWDQLEPAKGNRSWNWSAACFGLFWMAYRKMYLYSAIFIGLVIVEILLDLVFDFPNRISNTLTLAVNMVIGMFGNYWYKLHVERKTREIISSSHYPDKRAELARQGGTSLVVSIAFLAAYSTLLILLSVAVR